jgi:hypothetical protein
VSRELALRQSEELLDERWRRLHEKERERKDKSRRLRQAWRGMARHGKARHGMRD